MFIISEYYDEFTKIALSSYKESDIKQALNHHFNHPNLVRRLVTLNKGKVNLTSASQNPWRDEMKKYRIKPIHIDIIKEYLVLKQKKKDKELADFKKLHRGANAMSTNYTRLPSNNLRLNLKSKLSATEVNAYIAEDFEDEIL